MSQKRIENKFHSSLENYSSIVDDDQLWSEIESRVPKKKRKRRFLIWFAFGIPLLALVLIGFWWIPNKTESISEAIVQKQDSKEIISDAQLTNEDLSDVEFESAETTLVSNENTITQNRIEKKKREKSLFNEKYRNVRFENFPSEEDEMIQSIVQQNYVTLNKLRNEIQIQGIYVFPIHKDLTSIKQNETITIPPKLKKKRKRIKPLKNTKSFVSLNYYAGRVLSKKKSYGPEVENLSFGEDYFSHGLSVSYGRFISSKVYGKIIFAADKSYKKYAAQVRRDTLVPSSNGDQIISYTQYSNGVIDTESGIPIVKGTYNRDVLNLNALTSVAVGVGLGYELSFGKCKVNLEADIQRSLHFGISGLGHNNAENNIYDLKSFENYFSDAPKYTVNAQLNLDFALSNSILLSGGIQRQFGMSSILRDQTMHSEKINLIRGSLGVKKIIFN